MDILQLTYFKRIAELENVTKAAEELMVAQPALSKTVRTLETELDVRLFDRVGKKIYLNDNGRILLKHTNSVLRHLDDAKAELRDANSKMSGTVVISIQAATRLLPQIILGFRKLFPAIRIVVKKLTGDSLDQGFDFHIFSSRTPDKRPNNTVLLREECLIGMARTHRLAGNKFLDMRDLIDEDFFILQNRRSLSDITQEYCLEAGFHPKIVLECDHQMALFTLIENNMGIAFMPSKTWDASDHPDIILKPIRNKECVRYINMLERDTGYLSKMAQLFKEYLVDFFAGL